ncbi:putative oxidoreductase ORF334 [Glandiceps talaboti]
MAMLKWGVLSCSNINKRFIPALKQCARSELVAIASRDIQKAQSHAKEYHIPKAYGSYQDLLNDKEINVVYIPLPNSMHAEWTVKAAQSGKHCLVEKPLVTKVSDVELLQSAAKENKVTIVEAQVHPHHPQFLAIKDKLQSGIIGEIVHMSGGYDFRFVGSSDAIINRPELYGGSLWSVGCYPVMFMLALMDSAPQTVTAFKQTTKSGVDALFHGLMQYDSGVQGSVTSSIISPTSTSFEIAGTKGRIKSNRPLCYHPDTGDIANSFELQIEGQPVQEITVQNINPFKSEIVAFEDTVLDGKPQRLSLDLSKKVIATIIAFHESANQNGIPVEISQSK